MRSCCKKYKAKIINRKILRDKNIAYTSFKYKKNPIPFCYIALFSTLF